MNCEEYQTMDIQNKRLYISYLVTLFQEDSDFHNKTIEMIKNSWVVQALKEHQERMSEEEKRRQLADLDNPIKNGVNHTNY